MDYHLCLHVGPYQITAPPVAELTFSTIWPYFETLVAMRSLASTTSISSLYSSFFASISAKISSPLQFGSLSFLFLEGPTLLGSPPGAGVRKFAASFRLPRLWPRLLAGHCRFEGAAPISTLGLMLLCVGRGNPVVPRANKEKCIGVDERKWTGLQGGPLRFVDSAMNDVVSPS